MKPGAEQLGGSRSAAGTLTLRCPGLAGLRAALRALVRSGMGGGSARALTPVAAEVVEQHIKQSQSGQGRLDQAKRRLDRWTAEEGERIFAREGLDAEG